MQFTDRNLCVTDRQNPVRTVRTEFNPCKNIRAKQRNILSVDNEMQFTDRKVFLTDRQKPIRTVRTERTAKSINGPLQCGYIGQHSKFSQHIPFGGIRILNTIKLWFVKAVFSIFSNLCLSPVPKNWSYGFF